MREIKLLSINRLLEYILTGKIEHLKEVKLVKKMIEELLEDTEC